MKWTDVIATIIVFGLIVYEYIMSHRQYEKECEYVKKDLEKEYAEKNAECGATTGVPLYGICYCPMCGLPVERINKQ